jgi:hypothetical protein
MGSVDTDKPWVINYDAFVYDSDTLNHFIQGHVYIPTKWFI